MQTGAQGGGGRPNKSKFHVAKQVAYNKRLFYLIKNWKTCRQKSEKSALEIGKCGNTFITLSSLIKLCFFYLIIMKSILLIQDIMYIY